MASRRANADVAPRSAAFSSVPRKGRRSGGQLSPLVVLFLVASCSGAIYTLLGLLRFSSSQDGGVGTANEVFSRVGERQEQPDAPTAGFRSREIAQNSIPESKRERPMMKENCYAGRDYGVLDDLRASAVTWCSLPGSEPSNPELSTSYTFMKANAAGLQGTVFNGLRLDLTSAKVAKDIRDLSQDGGNHDPRYTYPSVRPYCGCSADAPVQDSNHGAPRVWNSLLAKEPAQPRPRIRSSWGKPSSDPQYLVCDSGTRSKVPESTYTFESGVNVVLLARKDDHNPFFQVSTAMNAWIMMQALNWSADTTQLLYLDKGIASPVEELHHRLIAPSRPMLKVEDLLSQNRKVLHFDSVLLSPYECTGPIMKHLDDAEPCRGSQLVKDFRAASLEAMGVIDAEKKDQSCIVTIISRRDYGGRKVQRVWTNEDEVLERMRADYGDRCEFRSIDFVDLSLSEQMRLMLSSDAVIGMHGAGMVNVLWTRPKTLVLVIFPKQKRRWGYRNICQHIACDWHDFRGGKDVLPMKNGARARFVSDPNMYDKQVPPDEWAKFAYPLLDEMLARRAAA